MKINVEFYKKFEFWIGLSLCYESIGIFTDKFFSLNGVLNIISLILGLTSIYFAVFNKPKNS